MQKLNATLEMLLKYKLPTNCLKKHVTVKITLADEHPQDSLEESPINKSKANLCGKYISVNPEAIELGDRLSASFLL